MRLRPCWPEDVWAYDFVQDSTSDARTFRLLTIIDEHTRECLAIMVARRLTSNDLLQAVINRFVERALPHHIRPDNGGEFQTPPKLGERRMASGTVNGSTCERALASYSPRAAVRTLSSTSPPCKLRG